MLEGKGRLQRVDSGFVRVSPSEGEAPADQAGDALPLLHTFPRLLEPLQGWHIVHPLCAAPPPVLLKSSLHLETDTRDILRAGSAPIPRGGSGIVMDLGEGSGKVLTAKNVHALRTLFNVAHKLHPLLGPSWLLVLENLNSLDRILNSPRTTTQVCDEPCDQD